MIIIKTGQEILGDHAPVFEGHAISRKQIRDENDSYFRADPTFPKKGEMVSFNYDVAYLIFSGNGQLVFTDHAASEQQVREVVVGMAILVTAGTLHRFESSRASTLAAKSKSLLSEGEDLKKTTHIVIPPPEQLPQTPPSSA